MSISSYVLKLKNITMLVSKKLSENIYVNSLNQGLSMILPFIIFGSVFTLIENLPIPVISEWIKSNELANLLSLPTRFTTDMISIYTSFSVAYAFGKKKNISSHMVGLLSILCFLIITPLGTYIVGGNPIYFISFEWVGAKGLFVSMFVSLTVSNLYAFFVNKGFTIKMPKEVPEVVGDSFLSLFPCVFVASIFLLLNYLMSLTIFGSLHECIYKVLQTPLTSLGNSLPAICIFTLLTTLLWWIGIHGGQIVGTFTNPIFIPLALENLSAFNNQSELPHVYTHAFNNVYLFGGSGMTISLCILMAFFSKSKQFKTLGRLTLPSNFFHINEPLLFSLPIMFNPIMFIPFMSAPLISVIIAYVATDLGLVPRLISYQFPWTMPPFLSGYLQGGIKVMLLQVVLLFITFLIYLPFFKIMDNKQQSDRENYTV